MLVRVHSCRRPSASQPPFLWRAPQSKQCVEPSWNVVFLLGIYSARSTAPDSFPLLPPSTKTRVPPCVDSRVLVAGFVGPAVGSPCLCRPKLGSAEIFDPSTGEWTPTATMNAVEGAVTAVALLDGRVLVFNGSGAEIFDPTTESWTVAASPPGARTMSTLLADGRVLAAGGGGDAGVAADLFTP